MDPKKVAILVLLLIAFVVAGRWTCHKWQYYHPTPPPAAAYGQTYPGYGQKASPAATPGGAAATPAGPAAPAAPTAAGR